MIVSFFLNNVTISDQPETDKNNIAFLLCQLYNIENSLRLVYFCLPDSDTGLCRNTASLSDGGFIIASAGSVKRCRMEGEYEQRI